MRILCNADGPWTVFRVYWLYLSAGRSGKLFPSSDHADRDWGEGASFVFLIESYEV